MKIICLFCHIALKVSSDICIAIIFTVCMFQCAYIGIWFNKIYFIFTCGMMAQVWYYLSYNVEILCLRTFQILTLSWIVGDYFSYSKLCFAFKWKEYWHVGNACPLENDCSFTWYLKMQANFFTTLHYALPRLVSGWSPELFLRHKVGSHPDM